MLDRMMFQSISAFTILLALSFSSLAMARPDYASFFKNQDACFVISDAKSGRIVDEYNPDRCQERFSPYSTFKIAAALMAFEKGILKNENQIIKWDRVHRSPPDLNQDQTPATWMRNSIVWVTQWLTPKLTLPTINQYLKEFNYGNQDFSGGLKNAWIDSTLKISAREQVGFLIRLWGGSLNLNKRSMDLTKQIIRLKSFSNGVELYGKTGTGCICKTCIEHPAKMIGWFVGVWKRPSGDLIFAANATDLKIETKPAGPRLKATVISLLENSEFRK